MLIFFLLIWANLAELDSVTRGDGRVVSSLQNQMVQAAAGGSPVARHRAAAHDRRAHELSAALRAWRRDCAMIFQQFNLVPYLSALANALLPCRLSNLRHSRAIPSATEAAQHLLTQLAIPQSHWHQGVTRLSIGQQQRVAAARALIGAPEIILADEPTSALDTDNRDRFLELLLTLAERSNSSVVFVSHDQSLAGHFHHHLALEVAP